MLKSKQQKEKYKGIDILYSIDQDLESWATIMYLVFQKDDLEEMMEPEIEVPPSIEDLHKDVVLKNEKEKKKKHATFELTLMQHVGGEVKALLQRKLGEIRKNTKRSNGYEAWAALLSVFKGTGSSTKAQCQQLLFDFKMKSPASKENLKNGLREYERILSKLRELSVTVDTGMLAIKLASSLPRDDTSCRIVHTTTMQSPDPQVRTVITAVEQLISQFSCDEYITDLDTSENETALYSNEKYCRYCKKKTFHPESACFKNPERKGKTTSKAFQKGVDDGIRAYIVARESKSTALNKVKQAKAFAAKKQAAAASESGFFADDSSSDGNSSEDNTNNFEYANLTKVCKHLTPDMKTKDTWLADSGATSHMTNSPDHLYDIKSTLGQRVTVGNGNFLDILCRGSLDFHNKSGRLDTLRNVLYIPGLHVNLVSIGKLQQRNLTTSFPGSSSTTKHAFIKNKKGQRILSATLENSLYKMDMSRIPHPSASLEKAFPTLSLNILHQRLAHLPFRKIIAMKKVLESQKICVANQQKGQCPCMGCAKGKLRRANVKKTRNHHATEPLEVIHTDISGPYATTNAGNRWMILFIDEFTRHTTMYSMKKKSDALTFFQQYKKYIENDRKCSIQQLSLSSTARDTILRLQSDGGGEYTSTSFEKYLAAEGIQQFTTNADNPSQNGIAERYIRTVSEAGTSMLRHARLQDTYWPYAMRSAVYILNRIPKDVLQGISPYEKWTGTSPDLRALRTFGVDAHVRVVTQNKRKGGDKAHPCTFLGYREGLKGYIFENKKTKRLITNGDAIFYEGDWLIDGVKRFDFSTPLCTIPSTPPPVPITSSQTIFFRRKENNKTPSPYLPSSTPESLSSDSSDASSSGDENNDEGDQSEENPKSSRLDRPLAKLDPKLTVTGNSSAEMKLSTEIENETSTPDPILEQGSASPTAPFPTSTAPVIGTPITPPVAETDPIVNIRRSVSFTPDTNFMPSTMRSELETISSTLRPRRAHERYTVNYNMKQKRTQSPSPPKRKTPPKRKKTRSMMRNRQPKRNLSPNTLVKANGHRQKRPSIRSWIPELALSVQSVHTENIVIPMTIRAALNSPQRTHWKEAMAEELKSLHSNSVLGPTVKTPPPGRKSVSSKWVFAIKRDENGSIIRYKARLVARGFTQRQGIDYDRTFAPVMKQSLLRAVLAEANHEDWDIDQIDIKTAFLYGEIDEEIYLKLPDGNIHLLQRALYGLKQAGRQWYSRFNKSLENFGLKRLHGDPCCYHMKTKTETLIVMVHVDDAIITGTNPATIQALKMALRTEYELKDMGAIKHCLGWEITRDRKKRLLTISQRQYIVELLKQYHVKETKTKSCPSSNITLKPKDKMEPKLEQPYMELLGAVLYVANSTRPDLSYSVSELSRYSSNPSEVHWKELNRILHYLNETQNHGLVFRGEKSPIIHGYVDASYARCPVTRKSRHGALLIHSGGAVDWRSKMQTVVATSSMEAEYIALCAAVKMAKWLQTCMVELFLSRQTKIVIGMDNQSAMIFAEEQMVQDRSKHIDIKFHYTREQIQKGLIGLEYVPTNRLPADAMTKPLPQTKLRIFRKEMGIHPVLRPPINTSLKGSVRVQPCIDPRIDLGN